MASRLALGAALLTAACSRHATSAPAASRAIATSSALPLTQAPKGDSTVRAHAPEDENPPSPTSAASIVSSAPDAANDDWPPWRRPAERLEPTCANVSLELVGRASLVDVSAVVAEVVRTFSQFRLERGAAPQGAFAIALEADANVARVRCGDALTCERFGALLELADPEQVARLRCAPPSATARRLAVGANASRPAVCARLRACEVAEKRSFSDCDVVELSGVPKCARERDCQTVLSCLEQRTEQARVQRARDPNLPQPAPQQPGKLPPGLEY